MSTVKYFHFRQRPYQFHFKMGFFFLTLFFFITFCALGTWQFYRYHFKQALLEAYQTRLNSTPKEFTLISRSASELQFQRVTVEGTFENKQLIYMQNQQYKGRMGYEVFTPMHITGEQKLLLVDRGWLPQEQRGHWTATSIGPQQITGYVKLLNEHFFILGKNIYSTEFPLILQRIDFRELEQLTHATFFPFIVRQTSSVQDGLTRDWIITSVLPVKHLGYSIQWFLMALVLIIAFFCFCCEPLNHEP